MNEISNNHNTVNEAPNPRLRVGAVIASAFLSECKKYRYSLTRIWDESKPKVMFVMLNPSTADGTQDDPTIRRCIGFAKSWGYGGMYVCNLLAYRSTDPKELLKVDNPFGDQNIWITRQHIDEVELVVCAWGNEPIVKRLFGGTSPYRMLGFAKSKLHYLELSKNGTPKHPLYLKSNLKPVKMYDVS